MSQDFKPHRLQFVLNQEQLKAAEIELEKYREEELKKGRIVEEHKYLCKLCKIAVWVVDLQPRFGLCPACAISLN